MAKLLVKFFGDPGEEVCELEDARYLIDFTDRIVVVDEQEIRSYDELVETVNQEKYRDREIIEVIQIPAIMGG
jgi:PDZ domain-containing secreted protein